MAYGQTIGNHVGEEKRLRQCWRTPKDLFTILNEQCKFTVDACASADNALLPRYWTEKDDCRKQSWKGERVFCNPPFGMTAEIMPKCLEAEFAVFLLPITAVITRYFSNCKPSALILPPTRIRYDPPLGMEDVVASPTLGSVYMVFGDITGMDFSKLGSVWMET